MTPERAGEEVPRQVPGTDKGEALDQLLVSYDVATDLLPQTCSQTLRSTAVATMRGIPRR